MTDNSKKTKKSYNGFLPEYGQNIACIKKEAIALTDAEQQEVVKASGNVVVNGGMHPANLTQR